VVGAITLPVLLAVLAIGCASAPDVVEQPTVQVSQFNSTLITPQVVKFQSRIVIRNRGTAALDFDRVDYAVDLFDKELFTSSFDGMQRTKGKGSQTVTFPWQIAMEDILDDSILLLAESGLRVRFRGVVYPNPGHGLSPMAFEDTFILPLPRMPEVVFSGADGVPLTDGFTVRLRVHNTNEYLISLNRVDSYLEINDVRYQLLHTTEATELPPDESGTVSLQMENTTGKTLSMVLNTLTSQNPEFQVGGTIECKSPYGRIVIPFTTEKQPG
jgi:hypothetical protein